MKLTLLALAALAVGCSSSGNAPLPACKWPASLNPPETGYTWSVGRALVQCTGDCVTEVCVSNDPTSCPGEDNAVGGSSSCTPGGPRTCVDACKPTEYAFFATDLGCTTPTCGPNVPSGCYVPTGVSVSPEGAPMCCPCE
jgi:hypothetical protein